MKIKSLFAILLALTLIICTCVLPASAKESIVNNTDIEIIIHNEVSEETRAKIERYFASGKPAEDDGATTYGLTCTLLGHNIKISSVSTINHKVRTSEPRCLKRTYNYEECTRCDYSKANLIDSEYIFCCN
jgi:hypothetical protein